MRTGCANALPSMSVGRTEDDATEATPRHAESTRVLGPPTPAPRGADRTAQLTPQPPRAVELTAQLPSGTPSSVSAAGRPHRDSAQPLDFSRSKHIGRFELIREIARGGM